MRWEMWDYEIRQIDQRQNMLEERKFAGNRREQRLGGNERERDRQTDWMGNSVTGTPGSIATGDVKAADVLIIICKPGYSGRRESREEARETGTEKLTDLKKDAGQNLRARTTAHSPKGSEIPEKENCCLLSQSDPRTRPTCITGSPSCMHLAAGSGFPGGTSGKEPTCQCR